ncbi:MAG: acylphosphatase [Candidatus Moranbacteria bacterium]|nr:acylphosphatase [Candidatus Moranbacteria bacterium]
MKKHLQIIVKGKVENTGFRFFALMGAKQLRISGEVCQTNGSICIEAEGEEEALDQFARWCKKGPEGCSVESFISKEKELVEYDDFKIL